MLRLVSFCNIITCIAHTLPSLQIQAFNLSVVNFQQIALKHFLLPTVYFTGLKFLTTYQTLLQTKKHRIIILIVSFILLYFPIYIQTQGQTLKTNSTNLFNVKDKIITSNLWQLLILFMIEIYFSS